ncbi:oxidoreductase [Rhodovulum tesquicola]|uniref:oxidoreductase n=1 Tax=Rhodovulum tesquicola TaxID=540254 RepID=UPI002096FA8E|nr:oxidoreductase [Rhodovulum tesquicola]MCO8146605.1 oxidoreductase [Rhodovulum tesquicola]
MPQIAKPSVFVGALVVSALITPGLHADPAPLPFPSGPVVLTVTGDIAVANEGTAAVFDLDMLRALPAETIRTTTIWTTGELELTGVPLNALLARLGVDGGRLTATAINDYAVEIPVLEAVPGGPIVAYLEDGAEMPRRKRGPLWIVYPFDENPAYRSDVIYSCSIWQLDRIDVAR